MFEQDTPKWHREIAIKKIQKAIDEGKKDFYIYPLGNWRLMVRSILNVVFGIKLYQ